MDQKAVVLQKKNAENLFLSKTVFYLFSDHKILESDRILEFQRAFGP